MFDPKPASDPSWLWRDAPGLIVIAGVLLFIGGEVVDRRWEGSLRRALCTVVSAKTEGQLRITTRGPGRNSSKAEYVNETTVEFQVDGVGPRRTVAQVVGEGSGFPVGQLRDCWVAGERMYLYPEVERLKRRWNTILWSVVVALSGGVWLWRRRSGLGAF